MTEWVSVIISGFSLIVAVAALVISWRTAKRQLQIKEAKELDRKIREKKANLVAYIGKETVYPSIASFGQRFLYLENKGLCEARNINLIVDGKKIAEHGYFPKSTEEIRQLGPQSKARYPLIMNIAEKEPSRAEITWEDNSGLQGKYSTTLTL